MMEVAKRHNLCLNCHKSSHYSKKCTRLSMSEATSHFAVHRTKTWDSSFVLYNKVNQSLHLTHLTHSSWHDGIVLKAFALLDSGSSTSFVFGTEFAIAQDLPIYENLWDTGVSHHSPLHSVINFDITPIHSKGDKIVSAVIIPRATSNLPQQPVNQKSMCVCETLHWICEYTYTNQWGVE